MPAFRTALASLAFACWASGSALADPLLADFPYPYPVQTYQFRSQGQPLSMAYMDVHPAQPNGRTIVLLHGKNFCGATWEATIRPLRDAGYRLIVPDQVGFCKSTKPQAYQFSLHQLALNTRFLLQSLGIEKPIMMGHSMGGMLAMRYVISFPGETSALVLVNPIGLEDWKAKGVPFAPVDQLYEREQQTSFETVKRYQQSTYYAGDWKPEYDRWVNMLVGMYRGAGGRLVAWDQALTSDMIFTQPVVYELELISVPTLLMIGLKDTTAIGKDRAAPEIARTLGNYPDLAWEAQQRIKNATLVSFPELGHAPHLQDAESFNKTLIDQLAAQLQ